MLTKETRIKIPDDIDNLYFCGDIHANLDYIKYFIKTGVGFKNKISNSCIILCGDVGLGFAPKLEEQKLSELKKICEKQNCIIMCCRGNHDSFLAFQNPKYKSGRVITLSDYDIIEFKNKRILTIGGGTSIDRLYRKQNGWGYWEDEKIVYLDDFSQFQNIQIICSHCAPTCAYPYGFDNPIVKQFCKDDLTLMNELIYERDYLQRLYNELSKTNTIEDWYYGHYHQNMFQTINNTRFHLLGINNIVQCVNSEM